MNHNLVVLDPAHGGPETGATLSNNALEKDLTLALARRLRTALTAAGFTVVTTRDADVADALTGQAGAMTANIRSATNAREYINVPPFPHW